MKKIGSWTWPVAANGTGRSGRNWLLGRLARIVRGSERKGTRVARARRVAPCTARGGDLPDRLRRAGLI